VKPVSILPLNVAPALMYYLPSWIATPNPSFEKSGTPEGKRDFFLSSTFATLQMIIDDSHSSHLGKSG
jgi:hypothetical protein